MNMGRGQAARNFPRMPPKDAWKATKQKRTPSIVVDNVQELGREETSTPPPSSPSICSTPGALSVQSSVDLLEEDRSSRSSGAFSPFSSGCVSGWGGAGGMMRAVSMGEEPPNYQLNVPHDTSNSTPPSLPTTPDMKRGRGRNMRRITRQIKREESVSGEFVKLNQYKISSEIGQCWNENPLCIARKGSYGIVRLAFNEQDQNYYAMKILDKTKLTKKFAMFRKPPPRKSKADRIIQAPDPLSQVNREIAILKKLSHTNVVTLVEVLDDPNDKYLYMVFEYLERGSVMEIPTTEPLSEELSWKYFRDTLKGLEYLHFQKIVHRDIKPSNLLISEDGNVKIADFGVSCEFEGLDAFLSGTAGTPAFMAPEALTEDSSHFYSGRAQDIWSLGITLYCFLYGQVPFWDPYIIALHKKIKSENVSFPSQINVSEECKSLIRGMLAKDPGFRLMLPEIKSHGWITKHGREVLPLESENCTLITVTEEEILNSVRVIPRLDTLILIKAMGQRKRFGNPFRASADSHKSAARCASALGSLRLNP